MVRSTATPCVSNHEATGVSRRATSNRLIPIDPDHAAFFDRQRQPAVLQVQRRFAEQFAAPAMQRGDVGGIVGGDLLRGRRRSRSPCWRPRDAPTSSAAALSTARRSQRHLNCRAAFRSSAGSRDRGRCRAARRRRCRCPISSDRNPSAASADWRAAPARSAHGWRCRRPRRPSSRASAARRGSALPVRARPRLPSARPIPWACAPASSAVPRRARDGNHRSSARSGLPSPR